ncbi:MAG: ROK family protein [Candidatus Komeilibacteria bacterium]|nr:ROK family protein [Candidatus Komeilibacteria bacterium]
MMKKKLTAKDLIIGIDIGGTKVKLVLMRGNKVLREDKYLVKSFNTPRKFLATLIATIELILSGYDIEHCRGIGIGLAGALDQKRVKVLFPPNLALLKKLDLRRSLRGRFNLPVLLENDTNAMALGEMMFGAGKGKESLVMISMGTGTGGGVCYRRDGKVSLLTGHHGVAGELGRMIINFNGVEGRPRLSGEAEQYLSAKFISRRSGKHPLKLQQEAERGVKKARQIYDELGEYLGYVLANIVHTYDPQIIVLGGGVSEAYKLFIKTAKETMKNNLMVPVETKITSSQLGDRAGAMGAAALFTLYD